MGIDYTIINKKNKTMYDLGKGGWYALRDDKEAFQDPDYLADHIIHECYRSVFDHDILHYSEEEKQEIKKYICERIVPDLFEFTKDASPDDIEIFGDGGDELAVCRSLGYIFTGTRFQKKNSPEWQMCLTDLNYHLLNPVFKKQYQSYDFSDHPFYQKLIK